MICSVCSLLRNLLFCLLTHLCLHHRGQRGEFRHRSPELLYLCLLPLNMMALSSSPKETQKKIGISLSLLKINECDRKKNSCLCKQKKSSAATENGITRRVFLPWEKSPGCRGRLGQRSYSLLGLSSWQAENNSITKSQLYTAKTILASVEGQKKPVKKKINTYLSPFLSSLQEVSQ